MLRLRDYQEAALHAVDEAARRGVGRQLVVLPTGAGKCVTGDTLVLANGGLHPLVTLGDPNGPAVQASAVHVWGRAGQECASHWYQDGSRATVRIRTRAGYELEGTKTHRILVWVADGRMDWKALGTIEPGDIAVIERGPGWFADTDAVIPDTTETLDRNARRVKLPDHLTPELAELMGYAVADGTLTHRTHLPITKNDAFVIGQLQRLAASVGLRASVQRSPQRATNTILHSVHFRTAMDALGLHAAVAPDKVVPWSVLQGTRPIVVAFLRGLFDGDGYVERNRARVGLTTASERLSREVQLLLLQLGIVATRRPKRVASVQKTYWVVSIGGTSLRQFAAVVGFGTPYKQAALAEVAARPVNNNLDVVPHVEGLLHQVHFAYRRRFGHYPPGYGKSWESYRSGLRRPSYGTLALFVHGYAGVADDPAYQELHALEEDAPFLDPIVTVESGTAPVYDLVVPGTHSFWANGFINHNTVLAAALSQHTAGRVLFLCHRDELVQQAVEKFGYLWPADAIGVVKAERDEHDRRIVVASVQTLQHSHRLGRLDPTAFSLAIVDEAHHALSQGYVQTLQALGFLPEPDPGKLLVGITATPMRGDGAGLGHIFEAITYRRSIQDLVRAGYLADVRGVRVATRISLNGVRRNHGDFQLRDLSVAVDTPARNHLVVEAYRQYGEGRKAVAFTVDIAHAQHLADAFTEAGYRADWIAGDLPLEERRARLTRFRHGDLDLLMNAQVLLEGYDDPSIEAVIMARPTRSKTLFIQAVGRGLRPYPGKVDCLVLDMADNGHDLVTLASLAGDGEIAVRSAERTAPRDRTAEDPARVELPVTLGEAMPVDLLARSQFVWRTERYRMILEAGPGQEIRLEQLDTEDRWTVVRVDRTGREALADQPLPLAYAQGIAEDWVRNQNLEGYAARDARWRSRPATDKQRTLLQELGESVPPNLTRETATGLIRDALRRRSLTDPDAAWRRDPASPRQVAWMTEHGIPVPAGFTKGDFQTVLDQWKRRSRVVARP